MKEIESFVYCRGCVAWIPYDDFEAVTQACKTIPDDFRGYAYHSSSQMKCSHRKNHGAPTYNPCQSRWICGDIGVRGKLTGEVRLLLEENTNFLCCWKNQNQCAGPIWNPQIQTPVSTTCRFWIDVDTNHNCVFVNSKMRVVAIAIKIFFLRYNENTRESETSPGEIVFVDFRQIRGVWHQMRTFFEKLKELAWRIFGKDNFPIPNQLEMIYDDGGCCREWFFADCYYTSVLHLDQSMCRRLDAENENTCTPGNTHNLRGIPGTSGGVSFMKIEPANNHIILKVSSVSSS